MRLWEIAENLHRADLSAVERAEHVAEWVKLTAEKGAQSAHPLGGKQPHDKAISAAANNLGVDRTQVQRAIDKGGHIAPPLGGAQPSMSRSG